jgi:hypothetical protein
MQIRDRELKVLMPEASLQRLGAWLARMPMAETVPVPQQ